MKSQPSTIPITPILGSARIGEVIRGTSRSNEEEGDKEVIVVLEEVSGKLRINGLPAHLRVALRHHLSLPHPNAFYIKRRSVWHAEHWDGRVHFMPEEEATCGLGLTGMVVRWLTEHDIPFDDSRLNNASGLVFTHELTGAALEDTQIAASTALIERRRACIQLDVSSGKSYVALNLMASVLRQRPDMKVAVIVSSKLLLHQMVKDAAVALPGIPVGKLGDGLRLVRPITIATAATIARGSAGRKVLNDWMGEVGAILVDEGHHATAETWQAVCRDINPEFLWAMSATMSFNKSEKVLGRSIKAVFGSPVFTGKVDKFRVPVSLVVHRFKSWAGKCAHWPSSPKDGMAVRYRWISGDDVKTWHIGVYRAAIDGRRPPDLQTYKGNPYGVWTTEGKKLNGDDIETVYATARDMSLMEFRPRDEWCVNLCSEFARKKEAFLVTALRTRHVLRLASLMTKAGLRVAVVDGSTKDSQSIVDAWKSGGLDGVVAQTSCMTEGVSIHHLVHLVKLDGLASTVAIHQATGRPVRQFEGKTEGFMHIPWDHQHRSTLSATRKVIAYCRNERKMQVRIIDYP